MIRKDRIMSLQDALEILKNGEYGVLSTASKVGVPYGIPRILIRV